MLDQINFLSAITVFLFNLFKLLGKENNEITGVEINSPYVPLNFQLLGITKDNKRGFIDLRRAKIENLSINTKFEHYFNMTRFMPESVICLKLNALSFDSLTGLINKLRKRFNNYKSLVELSLNIFLSNKDIDKMIGITQDFFKLNKPFNLELVAFTLKYVLKEQDVDEVLEIIKNSDNAYNYQDRVKQYHLQFVCGTRTTNQYYIFKLDEKLKNRMKSLCFFIKRHQKFCKLYKTKRILKNIGLFSCGYKKIVYLS
jgi:hypothetical protein